MKWHKIEGYNKDLSIEANQDRGVDIPNNGENVYFIDRFKDIVEGIFSENMWSPASVRGWFVKDGMYWCRPEDILPEGVDYGD